MASTKFKVCRRIAAENLWPKKLTPKQNTLVRKRAIKGNKGGGRQPSEFSTRLQHMTKLAVFYGNLPIYKLIHNKTDTYLDKEKTLLLTLESRLDVLLVRIQFCSTLFAARQLILHRHICVNAKVVNLPGFGVRNADIISISPRTLDFVKSTIQKKQYSSTRIRRLHQNSPPHHLEVNYKTLHAVLLYEPLQIKFPYQIELDLLV
jgi:small subunit ribosomal protein S4